VSTSSISCFNCGACCCRFEVLLISDTGVPDRYVEHTSWGPSRMRRLEDGWCAALDRNTMLCGIYEQRPLICRRFVMGGDECVEAITDWEQENRD
jgi:uncharacterized protein